MVRIDRRAVMREHIPVHVCDVDGGFYNYIMYMCKKIWTYL